MKEFHIINIGNSLLSNLQKTEKAVEFAVQNVTLSDDKKWDKMLSNSQFLNEIYNFLLSSPKDASAELNTFLRLTKGKEPTNISVYLLGTKTASNEICRITIERFLRERGNVIYTPTEVSGYFWEERNFNQDYATEKFVRDIAQILDRIIYLATTKQKEGYRVYINSTGGFKAHVIACAMGGFLVGATVYYMHEDFKNLVILPPLFYLPKGKEIELLKTLIKSKELDHEKLKSEFADKLLRLESYGLIEKEDTERGIRIRITPKGKLYFTLTQEG